jgi:hypothetical protein
VYDPQCCHWPIAPTGAIDFELSRWDVRANRPGAIDANVALSTVFTWGKHVEVVRSVLYNISQWIATNPRLVECSYRLHHIKKLIPTVSGALSTTLFAVALSLPEVFTLVTSSAVAFFVDTVVGIGFAPLSDTEDEDGEETGARGHVLL